MVFHSLKKSFVAKGCKCSLYALKFIGVSNCNRLPSNRIIIIIIMIIQLNSILIYLRANLTAQRPITKLARVKKINITHTNKIQKQGN
jgi:hypothetical protein